MKKQTGPKTAEISRLGLRANVQCRNFVQNILPCPTTPTKKCQNFASHKVISCIKHTISIFRILPVQHTEKMGTTNENSGTPETSDFNFGIRRGHGECYNKISLAKKVGVFKS